MSQYLPIAAVVVSMALFMIGAGWWSGERITDFADTQPMEGPTA